ncbi:MAG: DUF2117 domain-containing protein [Methanomassiliicoccales archaeon]
MKYAAVLHGPEVLDVGLGQRVLAILKKEGETSAVMSGITGIAAVIDAGLEREIDISRKRKPSVELISLDRWADCLILLNYAKSRESGLRFGSIVFSRCSSKISCPLIQVDNGMVIVWKEGAEDLATRIGKELGLELLPRPILENIGEEPGWRTVRGVVPGESVWVNGVVIGRACSDVVQLAFSPSGELMAKGMELKESGVKRLGKVDISSAHIRSGITRRTKAVPRSIGSSKEKVYFVDHAAEDAPFKCRDAKLVVSVGDDTSRITAALLYRFGVPTIAIVDGDEDRISTESFRFEGSQIFQVRPGNDDLVGMEVKEKIFQNKDAIETPEGINEIADRIERIVGERLISRVYY